VRCVSACGIPELPKGAKIAIGVIDGLGGLVIVGLGATWIWLGIRRGGRTNRTFAIDHIYPYNEQISCLFLDDILYD